MEMKTAENAITEADLSVMVLGVTGAGKSTLCNFISGLRDFQVGNGPIAVTTKAECRVVELNRKRVKLIDTPGFCDPLIDDETRITELGNAIYFAKEGTHSIALVLTLNKRFTDSEVKIIEELELLGEIWPFVFIVFTAPKSLAATENEQERKLKDIMQSPKCPKEFTQVMQNCDNRYMLIESTTEDKAYRSRKITEFINMVESIYAKNHYRKYTNKLFMRAHQLYLQAKKNKPNDEDALQISLKVLDAVMKMMAEMYISQNRELRMLRERQNNSRCILS